MIVETEIGFRKFIERWNTENSTVSVVYTDDVRHPRNNHISVILVRFDDGSVFILPFDHSECVNLSYDLLPELMESKMTKFCVDKKSILQGVYIRNLVDINIRKYLETGTPFDFDSWNTRAHNHLKRQHWDMDNINTVVPILKHKQGFMNMVQDMDQYRSGEHSEFYNDVAPVALAWVESSGLFVDEETFMGNNKHVADGLVFTDYNLFTAAGRPSNAHGNVNFAALNKTDGSRKCFGSRFGTEGRLVQMDYDAFHIRLIGNLIGYKLPNTSAHVWLGEQYFNKGGLTKEEYLESKRITFKLLYGGIDEKTAHQIEFFAKTSDFIDKIWEFARVNGYVPTPIAKRKMFLDRIDGVNKQKIFNYLLQATETEHNLEIILKVREKMQDMQSKMVLYTYDSFLFDVHKNEVPQMTEIRHIVEDRHKYPVKIEVGPTYDRIT